MRWESRTTWRRARCTLVGCNRAGDVVGATRLAFAERSGGKDTRGWLEGRPALHFCFPIKATSRSRANCLSTEAEWRVVHDVNLRCTNKPVAFTLPFHSSQVPTTCLNVPYPSLSHAPW